MIRFDPQEIEIDGDLKSFKPSWRTEEISEGLQIITLTLKSEKEATPPRFFLRWSLPSVDIYGFWNTDIDVNKVNYYRNRITSRASSQAPVFTFINNRDKNRLTVACSDALNKVDLRSYVREEDSRFYCSLGFFDEMMPAITDYKVQIRIDSRDVPFYEAINDVSDWWAMQENYSPAPVPEYARMPMYSTWYSFHQNISADEVVAECQIAKSLGFEAVIVDDGWQTLDSSRGYAYTGDWEPERIPDMKSFVTRVHDLGMKFLLWYSLPFIGEKSKNYGKFRGKYLRYWEGQGAYVLDPRYPEVREYIINTYERALQEWELDGFKLDFIGFFIANENTVMTASEGRDFASVNEAVDRLMTNIMARLRDIKPDIMIEFRQRYIGPLMRKYGNMFRAVDCPNNAVINRARTTDIRLLCGNTAAHSDMFMWHNDEPVDVAALQILNILFSVPQLSVKLGSVPEDHIQMIKFWINYWKENRNVLLDGKFIPENPGAVYPLIKARTDDKTIVAVFNNMVVSIEDEACRYLDIVNAKNNDSVVLDLMKDMGRVDIRIYDCMGNLVKNISRSLDRGVHRLNVPSSGLIKIEK